MRAYKNQGIEVIVQKMAFTLASKLPSSVEYEDLLQAGMLGWIYAAAKYDASRGIKFENYASRCVKGMMLDSLREGSWVTKAMAKKNREFRLAQAELEREGVLEPSRRQLAEKMNMSLDDYCKLDEQLANLNPDLKLDYSVVELEIHDDNPSIPEMLEEFTMLEQLERAVESLTVSERDILKMYIAEDSNPIRISRDLGLSYIHVTRRISSIMNQLHDKMKDWNI